MAKIKLDNTRQTYIFMWHQNGVNTPDGVKYIFNRSVSWGKINFRRLQPIIDLLGIEGIKTMLGIIDQLDDDINALTTEWKFDSDVFKLLEVHSEWENINLIDQKEINQRKEELALEYNAIVRKDDIVDGEIIKSIEKSLLNNAKIKLQNYLIQLHDRINDYFKEIYDPYIIEFEKLKVELDKTRNQIKANKQTLSRQNFMIRKLEQRIFDDNHTIDLNK